MKSKWPDGLYDKTLTVWILNSEFRLHPLILSSIAHRRNAESRSDEYQFELVT